jgi:DNA-binding winged helix-turn-helix (wHTH) protein
VHEQEERLFVFPPFRLNPVNECLWEADRSVALRPRPFAILRYLLEHPGRLITKEELLSRLWRDTHVSEAVLKTYLSEIRKALGDSPTSPRFIETRHGRGYRFIGALQHPAFPRTPARAELAQFDRIPFVGREREIEHLAATFDRLIEGQRELVFVTGDTGIGKTSLVRAFLAGISEQTGARIARGQCIEQCGAGEAYLPIFEAVRRLCRGPRGEFVLEVLRREAPTWVAQMPSLLQPTGATFAERSAGASPERMLREMTEALETLAEDGALILWVEDLQWADLATLDLISYLAQRRDPAKLLILATHRPVEAGSTDRLSAIKQHLKLRDQCAELSLTCLDERAVTRYLDARFAGHRFPPALAPRLHRHTGGNPLFMVTVVDAWLESGALGTDSAGCHVCAVLDDIGGFAICVKEAGVLLHALTET